MNVIRTTTLPALIVAAACLVAVPASAETGTITGRITYGGTAPAPKKLHVHTDSHHCGTKKAVLDQRLRVGADKGLKNAVVIITGMSPSRKATTAKARLNQKNCTFEPHVQSVVTGTTLEIGNSDPVLHNVHAFLHKRTLFNIAMPLQGLTVRRKLRTPGVVSIRCDSGHTWMQAYMVVVPHRFHATTNAGGHFTLSNVPVGKHKLRIWHESLGVMEQMVTVPAGGGAHAAVVFQPPKKELAPGVLEALQNVMTKGLTKLETSLKTKLEALEVEVRRLKRVVAKEARPLYLKHCATCHGERG